MTFHSIPLLLVALANLLTGLFVYRKNPSAAPHRAFGLMAAATAVWTLGISVVYFGSLSLPGGRLALAAASLIPLGALAFASSFPSGSAYTHPRLVRAVSVVSVIFAVLAPSPLIVESHYRDSLGLQVRYGFLHPLYALYLMTGFGLAIWVLVGKYRRSAELLRLQLRFLVVALSLPMVMATATNVLVPLIFRASDLGKYGPFFSLIMIAMVGHAIVRHRLMDIRVVIKRGAVYLVAVAVAGCALLGLLLWSNALFHDEHRIPIREIVLALLVAVSFQPIKAAVQRGFDRYLYREPYDYQRTIRRASRLFAGTIELTELVRHLDDVFARTLRPEGIAVYLSDDEDGQFHRVSVPGALAGPLQMSASSPSIAALATQRRALFRDELGPDARPALIEELAALHAEVLVPLLTEDRLVGFLVVGPKRSGDPYFSDDADLLGTLADQAALAIRNAQRHAQVVQVNEEIQRILATIESGVVSANTRGKIRLCNRAAETMLGAPAGRLRGQPVGSLPPAVARLIDETIRAGESRPPIEIGLPDPAGQMVPIMCSTALLRGPHDVVLGAVAVLSDLSHIKALEQERWRVERLASLEAIASGLVHEVRNPLVAIKTFIQLLPHRYADAEFRETSARAAERGITRVETLLARFRALSSVPAQPLEPLDVSAPLRATIELIRPQLEERGLRLRYVSSGAPRPVLGHALQLEQLFHNLCLNAIEAMQPGGELTVRLADLCEAGGATLLVEVSDTGVGIREDLLPTIFNPFVTTKAQGSGLGLAICRTIADTHRATIRARNNTERPGSTFTVEFPVPTGVPRAAPA